MPRLIQICIVGVALVFASLRISCGQDDGDKKAEPSPQAASSTVLRVVSGSENKALEPIIQAFAREKMSVFQSLTWEAWT